MRNGCVSISIPVLVTMLFAGSTLGAGLDTNNPAIPPDPGVYTGLSLRFIGPGLAIDLSQLRLPIFAVGRAPSGPNEIENFSASLTSGISVNSSPIQPASGNGAGTAEAFGKIGNVTGTFNTEMLALNITGTSPFGPYMLRESPTLASTGQTTIAPIGGGMFHIDSFFDVFVELSIDGGQTWIPDSTGPERITLEPEPGSALMLALAISGATMRRRRSAPTV